MNKKIIFDLTIFDNTDILKRYFKTIKELDKYIFALSGLEFDKITSKYSGRNYKGKYHYFNSDVKLGEYETFALLRTYVKKYKQGYGISSYDYGYTCPKGWNIIGEQINNILCIDSNNSYKVHFRNKI